MVVCRLLGLGGNFEGRADWLNRRWIVSGLLVWGLGGYLFGWLMWRGNVRRYGLSPLDSDPDLRE